MAKKGQSSQPYPMHHACRDTPHITAIAGVWTSSRCGERTLQKYGVEEIIKSGPMLRRSGFTVQCNSRAMLIRLVKMPSYFAPVVSGLQHFHRFSIDHHVRHFVGVRSGRAASIWGGWHLLSHKPAAVRLLAFAFE